MLVGVRNDTVARLAMEDSAAAVLEEAGKPGLLIEAVGLPWEERRTGRKAEVATLQ